MSDAADTTLIGPDTVVTFHYRLYNSDGAGGAGEFIESSEGEDPVVYLHGHNNVVKGLEAAMQGRRSGETFTVTISPDEGYGPRNDNAVQRVSCKHLHEYRKNKVFRPGEIVTVQTHHGPRQVVVIKAGKFNVDVDLNHPLAGATLYYDISIADVRPASAEELAHGHAHGPGGHHH